MGRIYALTLLVNLHVSKRKASPYTLPEDSKIKKLSISAEFKLLGFRAYPLIFMCDSFT